MQESDSDGANRLHDRTQQVFKYIVQENQELAYGLIQTKGGPCGLLASLQAHIIKQLASKSSRSSRLRPIAHESEFALVNAMTDIIWQSATSQKACFVL